ncbi:STAS domain-containing protein [Rhizobium paknamense]|uniref:MlaB-like STAS domain-containing protein n=1 Tax=Rhizobium paknamense TaxID=1206817 RepID=A0ABU0IGH2_9HYPH|nr:STAS domain-containing protein [Rhizobium paknamense]MDQ0457334.1 hypothetical protein [Rhizobium paknamense]
MTASTATTPVVLPRMLTIRQAQAVKELLLEALSSSSRVSLAVPEDAEVDLSFLQLVEAARITAARRGLVLSLDSPPGGALLDVLKRSGFLESRDHNLSSFWSDRKDIA